MRGMRGVKRLLPLILLAVLAGDVASRRPAAAEERPAERDFRTEFQQSFTAVPDLKSLTVRGNVRVGMEDSLWIGPGKLAESNAQQVKNVRQIVEGLGLEIASPDEAREILELKGGDKVAF